MAPDKNGFNPFPGSFLLPNANFPGPANLYVAPEGVMVWNFNPFQPKINYSISAPGET